MVANSLSGRDKGARDRSARDNGSRARSGGELNLVIAARIDCWHR